MIPALLAVTLFAAPDGGAAAEDCSQWRRRLGEDLMVLRSRYHELADFDPRSMVQKQLTDLSMEIAFQRDVGTRSVATRRGVLEDHTTILRGPSSLRLGIDLILAEEDQFLHQGYSGQRCGHNYEVHVAATDPERESAILSDVLDILETGGIPSKFRTDSHRLAPPPGKNEKAFLCKVVVSSAPRSWRKAVDHNTRTGWCPTRSDRRREFSAHFCRPTSSSHVRVVTDRGPLTFASASGETELQMDDSPTNDVVIPLGRAAGGANQDVPSEVLPARFRSFLKVTVRLPPPGKGRDRCLMELDMDLYDRIMDWSVVSGAVLPSED
jgi:hypothetical protein